MPDRAEKSRCWDAGLRLNICCCYTLFCKMKAPLNEELISQVIHFSQKIPNPQHLSNSDSGHILIKPVKYLLKYCSPLALQYSRKIHLKVGEREMTINLQNKGDSHQTFLRENQTWKLGWGKRSTLYVAEDWVKSSKAPGGRNKRTAYYCLVNPLLSEGTIDLVT